MPLFAISDLNEAALEVSVLSQISEVVYYDVPLKYI